jgi:hypothetical protein
LNTPLRGTEQNTSCDVVSETRHLFFMGLRA